MPNINYLLCELILFSFLVPFFVSFFVSFLSLFHFFFILFFLIHSFETQIFLNLTKGARNLNRFHETKWNFVVLLSDWKWGRCNQNFGAFRFLEFYRVLRRRFPPVIDFSTGATVTFSKDISLSRPSIKRDLKKRLQKINLNFNCRR